MSFTSLEFLGLLAGVFVVYYFLPLRARMWLLLLASYAFYCSWKPVYGVLILLSTAVDYGTARAIGRSENPAVRRGALALSVLTNLGMLGYFKYTDFALESLRSLLGPLGAGLPGPLMLVLPVGISFYTFQTMSYTIDVYRGEKRPERDFVLVALYVSFFPQLVAGPIERASKLMPQLATRQPFAFENIERGSRLILWGLAKKLVISDRLSQAAYPGFVRPDLFGTGDLVFSLLGMSVALYLDFSAYSEIARGTAQLFGIELARNFNFPNVATNLAEWWRRWHLTMSSWLKDYLYLPLLGGFKPRNSWHHARTTLLTMMLVGLWHGASWNFVLWGVGSGLALVLYRTLRFGLLRRFRGSRWGESGAGRLTAWTLTRVVSSSLGILFYAPDFERARIFFERTLVHPSAASFGESAVQVGLGAIALFYLIHYLLFRWQARERLDRLPAVARALAYTVLAMVVLLGAVGSAGDFIYFQF